MRVREGRRCWCRSPRLDADVRAVRVVRAALARDPRQPVAELLEDLARQPGVAGSSMVWRDHGLTTSLKQLASARDSLRNGIVVLGELGEARDRRAQVGGQAAKLLSGDEAADLLEKRRRRVERRGRRAHAGQRLARERAQRGQRAVEARQRGPALLDHVRAGSRSPARGSRSRPRTSRGRSAGS